MSIDDIRLSRLEVSAVRGVGLLPVIAYTTALESRRYHQYSSKQVYSDAPIRWHHKRFSLYLSRERGLCIFFRVLVIQEQAFQVLFLTSHKDRFLLGRREAVPLHEAIAFVGAVYLHPTATLNAAWRKACAAVEGSHATAEAAEMHWLSKPPAKSISRRPCLVAVPVFPVSRIEDGQC